MGAIITGYGGGGRRLAGTFIPFFSQTLTISSVNSGFFIGRCSHWSTYSAKAGHSYILPLSISSALTAKSYLELVFFRETRMIWRPI